MQHGYVGMKAVFKQYPVFLENVFNVLFIVFYDLYCIMNV